MFLLGFALLALIPSAVQAQDVIEAQPVETVEAEALSAPPPPEGEIQPTPESEAADASANAVIEGETSAPIRLTPDKTGLVHLSRNAVNVVVGNLSTLRIIPDTNRNLLLVPKEPGATFFRAIDEDGNVIMQRHVIVAAPEKEYIRIRRSCNTNSSVTGRPQEDTCKEYSVYYCPDMCHEVGVMGRGEGKAIPSLPDTAPQTGNPEEDATQKIIVINPAQATATTSTDADLDNPDAIEEE